jgi:outer membrane protein TolC
VLQTKVQLANAQDNEIKAQNNYKLAVSSLNNVIGLPLNTEIRVKDVLSYQPYSLSLDECTNYGLDHRPEMAQAQVNISIAKDQVKIARSGYLPTLAFSAVDDWYSGDFPGTKNNYWTVGLNASMDLFDGGLTKSQVKQANDGVTAAVKQAQQTHDNISLQIQQAYQSMKEAEKRIDTSNVAITEAAENYRMTNIRYDAGVGTNMDVVDAELDLAQARTNYIQALYDYNTSKAQLDQAMGVPVK